MSQGRFSKFSRMVGAITGPIAKARSETVRRSRRNSVTPYYLRPAQRPRPAGTVTARAPAASLPYSAMPAFWRSLSADTSDAARMLRFIILTACRYGEAAGVRSGEIVKDLWTIPAPRMKGGRAHAVPLKVAVLQVLRAIWSTKTETASRVRGRIEAILSAAKVEGLRTGDNPAVWRGHIRRHNEWHVRRHQETSGESSRAVQKRTL
jgi:integrase